MKIAILQTDWLVPELAKDFPEYPSMFERLLKSDDESIVFETFDVTDNIYPLSSESFDAFLITGSKSSVYDRDPWIVNLADYLRELHKEKSKIVGICFGHQIIAHALGGKVAKARQGWGVGLNRYQLKKRLPWMNANVNEINLLVSHQDQVIESPQKAEVLLTSEFCPIAAYQLDSHIIAFQGHPEFTVEYSRALMNFRRDRIPRDTLKSGLEGVEAVEKGANALNSDLVARWIVNFIKG